MDCFSLTRLAMTVGSTLPSLGRNIPNTRRMRGDVVKAVFKMYALGRSGLLLKRRPWPPFSRGPYRPRAKSAAAVRAHIVKLARDAIRTEGALVAADARLRRVGRKVLVAKFAVRPELQRHDCVPRKGQGSSQIRRAVRMTNIPRFRTDVSSIWSRLSLLTYPPLADEACDIGGYGLADCRRRA